MWKALWIVWEVPLKIDTWMGKPEDRRQNPVLKF